MGKSGTTYLFTSCFLHFKKLKRNIDHKKIDLTLANIIHTIYNKGWIIKSYE